MTRKITVRPVNYSYDELIARAFISPDQSNIDHVRSVMQSSVETLIKYLSSANEKPLLPSDLSYTFDFPLLNDHPKTVSEIQNSLELLLSQSMNANSPYYVGHMDSMPTLFSIVGDMIASGINNNMFCLELSPFLTQLEYQIAKEFCTLFGYGSGAGGIVLGGGTLANLQALIVARNNALGSATGKLASVDKELVIFCSAMAHVSVKKSAMIMGMGVDNVIAIPVDFEGHMDISLLENAVRDAIQAGKLPMAVVATAGTTVSGNIDPIAPIAKLCVAHDIWLHVDAIWGGGLIVSERHKHKLCGIEMANSITFNPQKWMMVAKTCSLVLFKDFQNFDNHFRIKKDYVRENDIAVDLSELSVPGTKRADVLKLWLSIQSMGIRGYESYVDHTMEIAGHFAQHVEARPTLKMAYPMETAMTCIRSEPMGDESNHDVWNADLQGYLLSKRNTFMSLPTFNGRKSLRVILLNPFLTKDVIDNIFEYIDEFTSE
jgi:glutamate/tyrosine decarboxylase-like PLP-dependent enzyme